MQTQIKHFLATRNSLSLISFFMQNYRNLFFYFFGGGIGAFSGISHFWALYSNIKSITLENFIVNFTWDISEKHKDQNKN